MASPEPACQPLPPEQLWQKVEAMYERAQQVGALCRARARRSPQQGSRGQPVLQGASAHAARERNTPTPS
jgi:hypothetical protein